MGGQSVGFLLLASVSKRWVGVEDTNSGYYFNWGVIAPDELNTYAIRYRSLTLYPEEYNLNSAKYGDAGRSGSFQVLYGGLDGDGKIQYNLPTFSSGNQENPLLDIVESTTLIESASPDVKIELSGVKGSSVFSVEQVDISAVGFSIDTLDLFKNAMKISVVGSARDGSLSFQEEYNIIVMSQMLAVSEALEKKHIEALEREGFCISVNGKKHYPMP